MRIEWKRIKTSNKKQPLYSCQNQHGSIYIANSILLLPQYELSYKYPFTFGYLGKKPRILFPNPIGSRPQWIIFKNFWSIRVIGLEVLLWNNVVVKPVCLLYLLRSILLLNSFSYVPTITIKYKLFSVIIENRGQCVFLPSSNLIRGSYPFLYLSINIWLDQHKVNKLLKVKWINHIIFDLIFHNKPFRIF